MNTLGQIMDSLRAALRREKAEATDLLDDLRNDAELELSEREARLEESPLESLERLQDEIAESSKLDDVRRKIEDS